MRTNWMLSSFLRINITDSCVRKLPVTIVENYPLLVFVHLSFIWPGFLYLVIDWWYSYVFSWRRYKKMPWGDCCASFAYVGHIFRCHCVLQSILVLLTCLITCFLDVNCQIIWHSPNCCKFLNYIFFVTLPGVSNSGDFRNHQPVLSPSFSQK